MERLFILLLLSYLIGSIPFSLLVGRFAKGIDLRKVGSGNVGGNNLIANAGPGWGLLGGALDAAKGAAAMWLAGSIGVSYPASLLAGLLVVAGHNWSIWLGFRGGKGLARAFGAIAWIAWPEAVVCALLWGLVNWRLRNGTSATIAAFVALGILFVINARPVEYILFGFGIVVLVFIASYRDLVQVNRSAKHWSQNFTAPK
ncbi:MAG: glycerol-3-phosphate acyltransferase [Anaerolineales bacterium]